MATSSVPCRVCGKMFVPCNKTSSELGAFNYRSIACSPECGAEYLRRVQAARQKEAVQKPVTELVVEAVEATVETEADVQETPKRTRGRRREANIIDE